MQRLYLRMSIVFEASAACHFLSQVHLSKTCLVFLAAAKYHQHRTVSLPLTAQTLDVLQDVIDLLQGGRSRSRTVYRQIVVVELVVCEDSKDSHLIRRKKRGCILEQVE